MKKSKIADYIELPNGAKLYLLPISEADIQGISVALRNEYVKDGKPIEVPTYHIEDTGETFEWDAESVEKDGTPEEKAHWKAHEQALNEFASDQELRVMYYIFTEGVRAYGTAKGHQIDLAIDEIEPEFDPPATWLKRQQKLGYVLPDDPYDRKYDFVKTVARGVEIQRDIITRAMALNLRGAVSDEGIAKYEATFRGAMEKAGQKAEARIDVALDRVSQLAKEE